MRPDILAIDFGTSNSAAAILENGVPRRLPIQPESETLPTAVFFPAEGGPIRIRVGMHTGSVVRREGDLYGRAVILASRITDAARGGEILVSAAARELADRPEGFAFGPARELPLKGLSGTQRVHAARW